MHVGARGCGIWVAWGFAPAQVFCEAGSPAHLFPTEVNKSCYKLGWLYFGFFSLVTHPTVTQTWEEIRFWEGILWCLSYEARHSWVSVALLRVALRGLTSPLPLLPSLWPMLEPGM